MDGDEGLFRAYTQVDFLAPVRAGDYVRLQAGLQKPETQAEPWNLKQGKSLKPEVSTKVLQGFLSHPLWCARLRVSV